MKTLILIPAYNEARNIASTLQGIRDATENVSIVVVSDGSTDATVRVAAENGAIVLPLPFNLGYGGALQTGFRYAVARGYDEVVQIDADGQHEPACIGRLLSILRSSKCDIVIGSRFLGEGNYRPSPARSLGMALLRAVLRVTTGRVITDPTSGFQALGSRATALYARDCYPVDYPDADVLVMVIHAGLDVVEEPVSMYERVDGKSMHSGLKPIWYMFKMLLSVLVTLARRTPVP